MKTRSASIIVLFPTLPVTLGIAVDQQGLISSLMHSLWLAYLVAVAVIGSAVWAETARDKAEMLRSLLWSAVCPAGAAATYAIVLCVIPQLSWVHVAASGVGGLCAANAAFVLVILLRGAFKQPGGNGTLSGQFGQE